MSFVAEVEQNVFFRLGFDDDLIRGGELVVALFLQLIAQFQQMLSQCFLFGPEGIQRGHMSLHARSVAVESPVRSAVRESARPRPSTQPRRSTFSKAPRSGSAPRSASIARWAFVGHRRAIAGRLTPARSAIPRMLVPSQPCSTRLARVASSTRSSIAGSRRRPLGERCGVVGSPIGRTVCQPHSDTSGIVRVGRDDT